jgi:hypothetical protein
MKAHRVVQWSTGNVGRRALRALIDRDAFEVVGVHAHAPEKIGRDAGELAGTAAVGLAATDDVDALLATVPDCVLYTPHRIDYRLVERFLRSGINVVTTGDFLTGTHHPAERARLDAAAREGGATFLGTGFEPGFVNVVAGFLTGTCRRVRSVSLVETLNCSSYPVREAWTVLGFAAPPPSPRSEFGPDAVRFGLGYFETLDLIATMLGVELDDKRCVVEYATATREIDLGWLHFAPGTVAGQRRTYRGFLHGHALVELAVCWTMSDDGLDPLLPDPEGFTVRIEGEPRIDATIRFGLPDDPGLTDESDVMGLLMVGTAMAAVTAVPRVCDAPPGVLTPLDLPLSGALAAVDPDCLF